MPFSDPYLTTELVYAPNSVDAPAQRNLLYWRLDGGSVDHTNVAQVADAVMALFAPLYSACLCTSWSFYSVNVVYRNGSAIYVDGASTDDAVAGVVAGTEVLPETDCVVLRRRTGLGGRSKRGRIFVGGVPESLQNQGRLTSGGESAYKAIANKMDQALVIGTFDITLSPVTPDFKNNLLVEITHSQVVLDLTSRRDRKAPKRPVVVGVVGV